MSSQNRIGLILIAVVAASVAAIALTRGAQKSTDNSFGDVSVSCGPSQRAMVQRAGTGASAQVLVSCVDAALAQEITYAPALAAAGPLAPVAYATAPAAAVPAVMYAPEQPVTRTAPAVRTQRAASAPVRQVEQKPSWQKRLLIIGGTSGAGAGIGALVGGKKGALIGAAIGGGGAAIVDQVKH